MATISPQPVQYPMYHEIEKVIQYWDKLIEQNSQEANSFLERGKLWLILKNYENALADFNQCLYIQFDNEEATEYKKVVLEHLQVAEYLPLETIKKLQTVTKLGHVARVLVIAFFLVCSYIFPMMLLKSISISLYLQIPVGILTISTIFSFYYSEFKGDEYYTILTKYTLNNDSNKHIRDAISDYFKMKDKYLFFIRLVAIIFILSLIVTYIYGVFFYNPYK